MRSGLFLFLSLVILSIAVLGCADRGTAATPGNPGGQTETALPPATRGPALVSSELLQGTWSTGCVADASGNPVTYTIAIGGTSMAYGKQTFSDWDCTGPGEQEVDQSLTFELRRVSDDPNDFQVIAYNGDPAFFDWVRYYQSQLPALEFIAADYTSTGSYAHRYYKR